MLAKIMEGAIVAWPYDMSALQADNPYTRFATNDIVAAFDGTEAWQEGARLVAVVTAERPDYDARTQRIVEAAPTLIDGQWIVGWNIIEKSEAEMAEEDEAQAAKVRAARNARLTATDWTQIADAPVNALAWANYRQALRDVPEQPGFPWQVTWPVAPK